MLKESERSFENLKSYIPTYTYVKDIFIYTFVECWIPE